MVNMAETEGMLFGLMSQEYLKSESGSESDEPEPSPAATVKRNKRKNFQPRSLAAFEEEDGALDLSDLRREIKRPRSDEQPIDLSAKREVGTHPPEDLREYAQNTVKELLQIYGLNSAEVAESITNNVPIANFSTGKILDCSSDSREPPTPPWTPQSPREAAQPPTSHNSSSSYNPPRMMVSQSVAGILALASSLAGPGNGSGQSSQSGPNPNQRPPPSTPPDTRPQTVPSTSTPNTSISPMIVGVGSPVVSREAKVLAPIDYSRYVRRFSSSLECGSHYCRELNYREHFHCLECNSRVFVKKEEMIRHFKWHKKRDESLQHGFMRYSPGDDCSDKYPTCGHNRKQTHYHCIQGNCDKVYISTSDVQMHANYHRKDSAIIQEGFQRLRATEECRTPYCAFFGQRTTHFHCRRDHCQFTFKNKADMEKHKTYHIKDEALARDGFKKFLKPDPCGFPNCRFSQVCNHIHCVRDGCNYVLHSSGQLLSHKRKHERKDSEIAYRKYKLAQQAVVSTPTSDHLGEMSMSNPLQNMMVQGSSLAALTALHDSLHSTSENSTSPTLPSTPKLNHHSSFNMSFSENSGMSESMDLSNDGEDEMYRYITVVGGSPVCSVDSSCQLSGGDHYHCRENSCQAIAFRCRETAEGHARMHEAQDRVSDFFYEGSSQCPDSCPSDKHYHCTWDGCSDIVMTSDRLEHFRSHEISAQQNNTLEALFRRKRGRPPKNRIIEVWNDYASGSNSDTPQAIFTSFKLPKPTPDLTPIVTSSSLTSPVTISTQTNTDIKVPVSQSVESMGFQFYKDRCMDNLCMYLTKPHYHCTRQRCFFATDIDEMLYPHAKDFHENIEILDGFHFFDQSIDCRQENCQSNKINRHFHCTIAGCDFSFIRYANMAIHKAQHLSESGTVISLTNSDHPPEYGESLEKPIKMEQSPRGYDSFSEDSESGVSRTTVVRASGTFFPMSGLVSTTPTPSESQVKSEGVNNENQFPEWMSLVKHERFGPDVTCSRPFCKLKRKEHYHCNACNQAFSELEKLRPHIAKHSPDALPLSIVKTENNNNETSPGEGMGSDTGRDGGDNSRPSSPQSPPRVQSPPPHHSTPPGMIPINPMNLETQDMMPPPHFPGFTAAAMAAMAANQQFAMMTSQGIPFMPHAMPSIYTSPSGLMFAAPPGFGPHASSLVNNGLLDSARVSILGNDPTADMRGSISPQRDLSSEAKKARVQSSMRMLKDEPVPEGYLRFRFNEDCRYAHCGYREHQTHFHCMRQDCGYSFCDKTRFVQHTARHERLDTLMGGDFQQYRANVSCGRIDCSYTSSLGSAQNKASHFHCLKCDFVCTDTNKVVAHRRQHQKLDSIMAAGFEKFTPSQPCGAADTCAHSGKQTHYHCLSCQYAVLGLSQMTAHKYRHME